MTSVLPPIPRVVFTILEPISLLAGAIIPVLDIDSFAADQLTSTSIKVAAAQGLTPTVITPTSKVLALQLVNLYGLLGMIGVGVLSTTTEPKVVRNFLIACAVADVGHVWATYVGMGYEDFVNVAGWNYLAWGNIGVTVFLFVVRIAYLAGLLGEDQMPMVEGARARVKKTS